MRKRTAGEYCVRFSFMQFDTATPLPPGFHVNSATNPAFFPHAPSPVPQPKTSFTPVRSTKYDQLFIPYTRLPFFHCIASGLCLSGLRHLPPPPPPPLPLFPLHNDEKRTEELKKPIMLLFFPQWKSVTAKNTSRWGISTTEIRDTK